ncbi:MAG: 5-formyltetrahydrofolate cyclo-ligase [Chitinophagaceae bacterium]|nr:5-formyltetrahydrofolate cyclo-ligase [Chitinophagaceae bacterium]
MNKAEIRLQYKDLRKQISSKDKMKFDDLLLLQFQQLPLPFFQTLFTYWPMAHQNEPNTLLYSSYLRHFVPDLNITYPASNFNQNEMQAILINEDTVYTTNELGITEPKFGEVINPLDIDVAFVPLLVCDNSGYRVGYGKGFYDKFLAQCRTDIIKIGFSYFEPIDKIEDTNSFDVPLTYCITPDNIYEF